MAYAIELVDQLTGTRQPLWLQGLAYATTEAVRYFAAARSRPWVTSGGVPGLSFIESLGLTLWAFPNDAKLALGKVIQCDTIAVMATVVAYFVWCAASLRDRQWKVSTVSYVPEQALIQRIARRAERHLGRRVRRDDVLSKTVNAYADISTGCAPGCGRSRAPLLTKLLLTKV